MAHTFDELKHMTVAQLREIASEVEHEAVSGYTQLNKEKLLPALCSALGIDAHAHHEVVGINKAEVKTQIKALREQRDVALAAHDKVQLKRVRRKIHHLKRNLHKATR